MPQPGTIEALCEVCREIFIPHLQDDKIRGAEFDQLPQHDKEKSGDWFRHYVKESGEECNGWGTLTDLSWSRLRHPTGRRIFPTGFRGRAE